MEKYYARVKFSFGTYMFYTFDSSLVPEDMVVCMVKNYYQVGEFVEYTKYIPKNAIINPIFGTIEGMVLEFEQKEKFFKKQNEPKQEYRIYGENSFYKTGDIVLANDVVWKYDGINFIFICSKKQWDERNA